MISSRHSQAGGKWREYSRATARMSRRLSRSTAASAGFTSCVATVFTSTKHRVSSCQPIKSISPRRLGTEITCHHGVSMSSEIEIGVFFPAAAGAQVLGNIVGRQNLARDPIENTSHGLSETARKHDLRCYTTGFAFGCDGCHKASGSNIRGRLSEQEGSVKTTISGLRGRATNRGTSVQWVCRMSSGRGELCGHSQNGIPLPLDFWRDRPRVRGTES